MTDFVSHLDITDEAKAMLVVAGIDAMQRTRQPWSERDLEILRNHYPRGGASKCAELLPHRTHGAIGLKARTMGLPKPPFKRHASPHFTTPYIDEAIRRYYQGTPTRGGLSKLAHQVGRPVKWVSSRAFALSLSVPRFDSGKWTNEELALLRQHATKASATISRIFTNHGLTRSANAIQLKLTRLRCDRNDDDMYTLIGLAGLFGVDRHVVSGWIKKGWLRARKHGTGHPSDSYDIHHTNVRRFVIENVGAIDIRRVDKHWFVDLLVGR